MQSQVRCFGLLIGSLLAVMPTSTVAQSLPGINPLPCQMVDEPTSETYCRPLADTILPRGVTVAASDGSLALVDSVRVVGAFNLDGPTIQVIDDKSVVAQSGQDVLTTGSNVQTRAFSTLVEPEELRRRWAHSFIGLYLEQSGSNDAQGAAPPLLRSPSDSASAVVTAPHTDALASPLDTASSRVAQSSAAPLPQAMAAAARGVTDTEVRFGISAPFTGPARELGRQMKLGIEAAFNSANEAGGVHGRQLKLISADDGYEPTRTAETVRQLHEKHQILGFVGNVGTPTGAVALPYALENKLLFFGPFTGAKLFRAVPPDRYVFNYRASYAEETEAVVRYLVRVRGLRPSEIAVFAQQDAYGDDGFAGVAKALRALQGGSTGPILRLNYQRNSVDVAEAVAQLRAHQSVQQPAPNAKTKASPKQTSTDARPGTDAKGIANSPIKAVVMIPAYRTAAKFIELTRPLYPKMI